MEKTAKDILEQVVQAVVKASSPERIILFGSWAEGTRRPDSDVDLLIIQSKPFGPDRSRRREIARIRRALWDLPVPIDILVFSKDEIDKWKKATNHIIARSLRQGKVIYDSSGRVQTSA